MTQGLELNPGAVVLGILNVTPDSFSDGGQWVDPETALGHARTMLAEGADMIDVGGESTRPGAAPTAVDTELERIIPIIEVLAPECPVSVDTRREEVARAAVAAGATVINDITASLWPVAAETGAGWIAMHMQGEPGNMQRNPSYRNVVTEVRDFLVERAEAGRAGGVERIWIDPGFGFGKTLEHNLQLLAGLDQLIATGWPVAVGTSRKSVLGRLIARSDGSVGEVGSEQEGGPGPVTPPGDRLVGSVCTATYAMLRGASLIRVHDVKAAKQAATVVAGELSGET